MDFIILIGERIQLILTLLSLYTVENHKHFAYKFRRLGTNSLLYGEDFIREIMAETPNKL